MKTCPVCKHEFVTTIERKKYCDYGCQGIRNRLVNRKNLDRLSPEEITLRKELMRK
jgi:hypothetical protein